ncbi:MAG: DEAD/DEAH box helicase [Clostridia bacterium]|nr:DEAD/DEAH box helicase [Clostridia bacterium]
MLNGPHNLWAQVYLADGGARLGKNYGGFLEQWFWPCGPHDRPWITYSWKPKYGAQGEILGRIRDICLSITPPPGIAPESRSIIRPVQLPNEARALYDEFEEKFVLKLEDAELSAADQAPLLSKLQQFAGGAVYTTDTNHWKVFHDEKLQELQELVEAAGGEPILCFYQFRHEAVRIHEAFPQSRSIASAGAIEDWNRGRIPLLLAHPASSGHGLNLQFGGSIIVWFGLTFDAELYQQANARLVRQGQKQLVRIYHIIAENTRDEDILPVLEGKTMSQDAMIRALVRRKRLV